MPIDLRTPNPDRRLKRIVAALEEYAATHPKAQVSVYRHNDVSVRIRVIDPTFKALSWADRESDLWAVLEKLPEDVVSEISVVILLAPQEAKKSIANMDFEDPIPSRL
jgi:hypothetical protein